MRVNLMLMWVTTHQIKETDERLARMEESERPGLVVFVVVTDGYENSSREFTKSQLRKMIEHRHGGEVTSLLPPPTSS